MNLEEKFFNLKITVIGCNKNSNPCVINQSLTKSVSEQCVQICDEFAVGFQNFIDGNCMCLMIDGEYKGKRMLLQDQKYYTTTELLEIYKQGL